MKKELLKSILRNFSSERLSGVIRRVTDVPTHTGKIITLSGSRRSGKTYLLLHHIQRLVQQGVPIEQILYLNFEDERLDLAPGELDLILQAFHELYPDTPLRRCYVFFDEIQNIQGWDKFVRRIYDSETKNIFITGSNSKLLSREIATSLRGRTITIEVFPLSFGEYLTFSKLEIDIKKDWYHTPTRAKLMRLFQQYLLRGGFPETTEIKPPLSDKILQEYLHVMTYRDIIERYGFTNVAVLRFLIRRLLGNTANSVSVNKIYNELKSQGYKISKNLLYEMMQALQDVYLISLVHRYEPSIIKQEMSEKKIYAIDNGLINAMTFKLSRDYGRLLENLVFLELRRRHQEIFFHKGSRECDFLTVERATVTKAYQVCYDLSDPDTRKRELEGLIDACQVYGLKHGTIITLEDEEELKAGKIRISMVPAVKFLLENKI